VLWFGQWSGLCHFPSLPSELIIVLMIDLLPPVGLADNKVEPEDLLQQRGEGQRQQPQPQYEENL
jgi:hypothetical protein